MTFALIFLSLALAETDAPSPADPIARGVRETQVSCQLLRKGRKVQFRATAMLKGDGTLTVLTAAHAIGPADEGAGLRLTQGTTVLDGQVEAVARNPHYRSPPAGDVPGADNAVARFRFDGDANRLNPIATAELARWAVPDPSGSTVPIQMIDQFAKGRAVRAGNFTNPRWLEWGPSYSPVSGDSGSGVFVLRREPDGTTHPLLIGVVVDRAERGGGASLLSRKDAWVEAALRPAPTGQ